MFKTIDYHIIVGDILIPTLRIESQGDVPKCLENKAFGIPLYRFAEVRSQKSEWSGFQPKYLSHIFSKLVLVSGQMGKKGIVNGSSKGLKRVALPEAESRKAGQSTTNYQPSAKLINHLSKYFVKKLYISLQKPYDGFIHQKSFINQPHLFTDDHNLTTTR